MSLRSTAVLAGRYRLAERIATGGMGEVWRADDMVLNRAVAVKVLKPEYAGSQEFRIRFSREAQHAAALSHPGVAQMYDSGGGDHDHPPYLVMELIDGEPLSAVLAREGRLSPERTADIVAQAAAGLDAAHESGLVHRDVKPDNLLICRDGTLKITDFGIARAIDAAPLTRTDMVVGTPLYLSPEQAAGQPATAVSDLYSLGVVAYECFNGRPPFEGDPVAVTLAHRDQPLPRSIPGPLGELVAELTAKDPTDRPASAAHVAAWARRLASGDPALTRIGRPPGLAELVPETDLGAPVPGNRTTGIQPWDESYDPDPRPRRRGVLLMAGVAVVAAAGGGGWLLRDRVAGPAAEAETGRTPAATRQVRVDPARYRGQPLGQVQQELRQLGLRPTVRRLPPGRALPGIVQRVAPVGLLEIGSEIKIFAGAPERRKPKDRRKDGDGERGRGNSGKGKGGDDGGGGDNSGKG